MSIMQVGWIERDDFQITVLTDQVERRKHKNYGESVMKCPFFLKKTTSHKWSALHAVHSYNQWLEINNTCSQQTFIIGLNCMPDVLLQLLKHVIFLHSLWLSRILREKLLGAKRSGYLTEQVMSQKHELKCPEKLALSQVIHMLCMLWLLGGTELITDIRICVSCIQHCEVTVMYIGLFWHAREEHLWCNF